MRNTIILAALILARCGAVAVGAPAPLPLVVNSQSPTAPGLTCFRASETPVRATFGDGLTATPIAAGEVPFLAWSLTSLSTNHVPASYTVVAGLTGVVDFVWSPSDLNYTPGTYFYEIGVNNTNGNPRTLRWGKLTIIGSPYSSGQNPITWSTNWNLGTVTLTGVVPEGNLPMSAILTNLQSGSGITQADGDARYVARQGDYTGTVAGVSASIVATSATNAAARVAAVESAGYQTGTQVQTAATNAYAAALSTVGSAGYLTAEAQDFGDVLALGNVVPRASEDGSVSDSREIAFEVGNGFPSNFSTNRLRALVGDGRFVRSYDGSADITIWDSYIDGHNSGLDADLLDGQHGSAFVTNGAVLQTLSSTAAPVSGAAVLAGLAGYLPTSGGYMQGDLDLNGNTASNSLGYLLGVGRSGVTEGTGPGGEWLNLRGDDGTVRSDGALMATGSVYAAAFFGDGAGLTNLAGASGQTMASTPWTDPVECVATGRLVFARGAVTTVLFDSEIDDPSSVHSWGRMTCTSTGRIEVTASVYVGNVDPGCVTQLRLLCNADVIKLGTRETRGATAGDGYATVEWKGNNKAATNVWSIGVYLSAGPATNVPSTAVARYTSLSFARQKNAGE